VVGVGGDILRNRHVSLLSRGTLLLDDQPDQHSGDYDQQRMTLSSSPPS
jgi:hypothetical protein